MREFSLQSMDIFSIFRSRNISSPYFDSASNRCFIFRVLIEIIVNLVLIPKCQHNSYLPWPVNRGIGNRVNYLIVTLVLSVIPILDTPYLNLHRKQYSYERAAKSILKYQS